jgi:hypothetical protein
MAVLRRPINRPGVEDMKVKRLVLAVLAAGLLPVMAQAQVIAFQRYLVDMPTAGMLARGSYALELEMYEQGGLMGGVYVGVSSHLMFGVSYGGTNIIGGGDVQWNPEPGIEGRARLIDENVALPGVMIGFTSQGSGAYSDSLARYRNKSLGLFVVVSKNFAAFHNIGLHGGFNYSFETEDRDKEPNFFLAVDLSFAKELRFIGEYNFAINDNENKDIFGSGSGYMNGGIQWLLSPNFFLQLNLKDLFGNAEQGVNREVKIGYFERF